MGVTEPQSTFSAGFGAAFLPLHPAKYAELLGAKLDGSDINVWLINTGWSGGSYGVGSRIKLSYTRALITAALNGKLDNVEYLLMKTDHSFSDKRLELIEKVFEWINN